MNSSANSKRSLTERLDQGEAVICAEGFLFEMERRGYLSAGEFVPEVALEHPEALENLHRDFQHAGSDVVEAFTYNGHREKMRVIGKEELLEPLNRAALKIARKVANDPLEGQEPQLMAGNISNTNIWNPEDTARQKEIESMFDEMCGWAVEEGADMLVGETFYYAGEAFKALEVMQRYNLPTVLTVAPMAEDQMLDGWSIVDTLKELEQRGATVTGLNCFRGPATMMPWLKEARPQLKGHMGCLPLPYRTTPEHRTFFNLPDTHGCACPSPHGRTFPTALDPLFCNRYEIRQFAEEAWKLGIQYQGICCGANPMLIREVAEACGKIVPASRYSERMEHHFMYGTHERIPEHIKKAGEKA